MVRHSLSNDSRRVWGLGWGTYAWLLAALLCSGCTIAPNTIGPNPVGPIEKARLFLKAFAAVDQASRTLLNDFAIAERRQGRQNAEIKAKRGIYEGACKGIFWAKVNATSGYIEGFCVDDAPYFSELGDPPATEALRLLFA
jgi:hypothetical protein